MRLGPAKSQGGFSPWLYRPMRRREGRQWRKGGAADGAADAEGGRMNQ
jgi:hypothetical protein